MKKYIWIVITLAVGFLIGWLVFSGPSDRHSHEVEHTHEEGTVWTCSMHPQIRMSEPGKCPLCAMDLIPLKAGGSGDETIDPDAIQMSAQAVALANIQTSVISRANPVKQISLYGTIQADERLSQSQTAHVGGRIERLLVNFTGERVRAGQTIATVYSPELLAAQQELIEATKIGQPSLLEAAREKLRGWKLADSQITAIESSGQATPQVDIAATVSGIVTGKRVNQGDYVSAGSVLFDIADLGSVWAMFDAYEADLPFLRVGDKLDFTLQAVPGRTFSGRIAFIDQMLNPTTRTAKVRAEVPNPGGLLKPEMYATATVTAPLRQYADEIVIPRSSVLWTGRRSIVYVRQPDVESPAFLLREVELGPSLGDSYVVLSGVNEGDRIVTNGAFTIDASAQLEGKRSMMNQEVSRPTTGHEGHNMSGESTGANPPAASEHTTLSVHGLCDMCKTRIEKTALSVNGVTSATWDKATGQLHLNFDPSRASLDAIGKALAAAGHDNTLHRATDAVYNALPGCCKYRG